jgi:hypothetical protein
MKINLIIKITPRGGVSDDTGVDLLRDVFTIMYVRLVVY